MCITHPHEDHFKGINFLIERISLKNIKQLWISDFDLVNVFRYRFYGDQYDEEQNILIRLRRLFDSEKKIFKELAYGRLMSSIDDVDVIALFPNIERVKEYDEIISNFLNGESILSNKKRIDLNEYSGCLLLKYGISRILLAADATDNTWDDMFSELSKTGGKLYANGIKVAHHGSGEGNKAGFWNKLKRENNAKGAAFISVGGSLVQRNTPHEVELDLIKSSGYDLFCTNYGPYCKENILSNVALSTISPHIQSNLDSMSRPVGEYDSVCMGDCGIKIDKKGNWIPIIMEDRKCEYPFKQIYVK